MRIEHNVPFSSLTTLRVGGIAHTVVRPTSTEEIIACARDARDDFMILGGGSNVLVRDDFEGIVCIPGNDRVMHEDLGNTVLLTAEAGVSWDGVVAYAVAHGWWGIENLSAIPGTLGGAVVQNIGAYGSVLSECVVSVAVFDRETKTERTLERSQCEFGYRTSIFKQHPDRFIVLAATLALSQTPRPSLNYPDLAVLAGGTPSLGEIRRTICSIRSEKFPNLDAYGTAGSFFLNPIVSKEESARVTAQFPEIPLFSLPEGGIKVPLGWILDHIVHAKELRVGGAFVWPKQALVIATEKHARASDVLELSKVLRERVFQKTGIAIEPEVHIV